MKLSLERRQIHPLAQSRLQQQQRSAHLSPLWLHTAAPQDNNKRCSTNLCFFSSNEFIFLKPQMQTKLFLLMVRRYICRLCYVWIQQEEDLLILRDARAKQGC